MRVHDCAQFVVGVGAHHLRASAFRVAPSPVDKLSHRRLRLPCATVFSFSAAHQVSHLWCLGRMPLRGSIPARLDHRRDTPVARDRWHLLKIEFDGTWVDVFLDGARYIEADDRHISGAGTVGVVGQYETEPRDAIPVRRIRRAQSIVRTTPSVRESPTLLPRLRTTFSGCTDGGIRTTSTSSSVDERFAAFA